MIKRASSMLLAGGVVFGLAAAAHHHGCLLGGSAAVAAPAPATSSEGNDGFKVDSVHSFAFFKVLHNSVAYSGGRFKDISGTFNLDSSKPEASSIDLTIKIDSIDTANEKRDQHLKSGDFFSAKEFPTATFKSKSVKKTADGTYEVAGDLTLRGTTKPLTATVKDTGQGAGMRGEQVAGLWTEFTINRNDFGVSYMSGSKALGDQVTIMISLEGGK